LIGQSLRAARLRNDALSASLAPAQLRARLAEAQVRFDSAYTSCNVAIEQQLEDAKNRLGLAVASLDALSPLAVLQRGFAVAQKQDGSLLRDAKQVETGDAIKVRLARGRLGARVESVEES